MNTLLYPCLWLENEAKEAAVYYCSIFPNSMILDENPMVVTCELNGGRFMLLNGNHEHKFNDSISFVVSCETQEEIDYYWRKLTDGGRESMCGWLTDKYGVSWQIVPSNMAKLMSDPVRAERIMKVVFNMRKLDIERIENA